MLFGHLCLRQREDCDTGSLPTGLVFRWLLPVATLRADLFMV